jgi:crotonobetainyl-CoA:carnitine CoA-transferase CaiB-like acyl-CoA transferase
LDLFSSINLRNKNDKQLSLILEIIIKTKESTEWLNKFKSSKIPAIKNTLSQDIHSSSYNVSRKMIVSKDFSNNENILYKEWGKTTWSGNPTLMTNYDTPEINPVMFSENTSEILKEIGLTNKDILEMKTLGAIPKEEMLPFSKDSSEPL